MLGVGVFGLIPGLETEYLRRRGWSRERSGGACRRAYSRVLIKYEPLLTVDEGQGRSFAPLRINSGKLLIINLIIVIIRFMTINRAPRTLASILGLFSFLMNSMFMFP